MGYYQGDYYRGDYYRGDPGLFSWAGKLLKRGLGAVGGLAQTVFPVVGQVARKFAPVLLPQRFPPPPMARITPPAIRGRVERGQFATIDIQNGKASRVGMDASGCCPTGYHPVKSGEGYCVRNRSMNVTNPRALRRGLRRVAGFAKTVTRTRRAIRAAARAVK